MSLAIEINGREVYRAVLGTHPAALTIGISGCWFWRRISIAYADHETAISEVIG